MRNRDVWLFVGFIVVSWAVRNQITPVKHTRWYAVRPVAQQPLMPTVNVFDLIWKQKAFSHYSQHASSFIFAFSPRVTLMGTMNLGEYSHSLWWETAASAVCPNISVKDLSRRQKEGFEILTAIVKFVDFGHIQVAQSLPLSNMYWSIRNWYNSCFPTGISECVSAKNHEKLRSLSTITSFRI